MTQMVQPIWYDNVKISFLLEVLSTGSLPTQTGKRICKAWTMELN